jgi:hypothetical protein
VAPLGQNPAHLAVDERSRHCGQVDFEARLLPALLAIVRRSLRVERGEMSLDAPLKNCVRAMRDRRIPKADVMILRGGYEKMRM